MFSSRTTNLDIGGFDSSGFSRFKGWNSWVVGEASRSLDSDNLCLRSLSLRTDCRQACNACQKCCLCVEEMTCVRVCEQHVRLRSVLCLFDVFVPIAVLDDMPGTRRYGEYRYGEYRYGQRTHGNICFKHTKSGAGEQFLPQDRMAKARVKGMFFTDTGILGWDYLSIATCLMRPHLFYVCMFRITDHICK